MVVTRGSLIIVAKYIGFYRRQYYNAKLWAVARPHYELSDHKPWRSDIIFDLSNRKYGFDKPNHDEYDIRA